jgi:hypothetical protein
MYKIGDLVKISALFDESGIAYPITAVQEVDGGFQYEINGHYYAEMYVEAA